MKNISFLLITALFISITLSSCSDTDKLMFDKESSYIYFSLPFKKDYYGNETDKRVEKLEYSFAFDGPEVKDYTFKVPISIAGLPSDKDRNFSIDIDKDNSNIEDTDWDKTVLQNTIIKKGILFDTIMVKVNRTEILKSEKRTIKFRLIPNNNFALSDTIYSTALIEFSDILIEPSYWYDWEHIFGGFCPEVYLKWRELFKEGIDSEGYSWKEMPWNPNPGWYPLIFSYITVLRDYFEENVVYPNGDASKPRIRINY